jgi:DNA-binding NtrC family response regulator
MTAHILVVDDEQDMLTLLKRSLEPELDCIVETASSGESALKKFARTHFDIVLADIKMPGMNGLELLELMRRDKKNQTVIMMTAFGHIEMAVKAMKSGAYDFITKPFEHDTLVVRLEKALERSRLLKENLRLHNECLEAQPFQNLVGSSRAMQRIHETIQTVAKTDLTVLITGESGTGKDGTARAIHTLSKRKNQPYVAVNCPTIPESILESELFGFKKGAFTHATNNKTGLFQEAHRGTIFLDEIGDISPAIQAKLLRVIQEKEFKPLGDTKSVQVDVRIIASTNQDLPVKITRREFREDLYYRLNVLPIELPPLRERAEDIPLIVSHLLARHCAKLDQPLKRPSPQLLEFLMANPWQGNVRELENSLIQGIMFSDGEEITPADIDRPGSAAKPGTPVGDLASLPYKEAKDQTLNQFNQSFIGNLLERHKGNVTHAAKACGLERQALQQIMRRYGIQADAYRS